MTTEQLYSISTVAAAFEVPVSTLRYYDEIGLVPAPYRRSRVRHYDRRALERLAYVQLWRRDGMLSIEHTLAIMGSVRRDQRNELLDRGRAELADRIRRLQDAADMLSHLKRCPKDDHLACPVTSAYVADRVDAALGQLTGDPAPRQEAAGPTLLRLVRSLVAPAAGDMGDRGSGTG